MKESLNKCFDFYVTLKYDINFVSGWYFLCLLERNCIYIESGAVFICHQFKILKIKIFFNIVYLKKTFLQDKY